MNGKCKQNSKIFFISRVLDPLFRAKSRWAIAPLLCFLIIVKNTKLKADEYSSILYFFNNQF